ncbi:MAG: nucleotidyl transferase AbiEii/AbiGii toxin family protein [Calditrichaceae bacterium]|nr:nucleotidyl transferase AbiEii/AbiGii toxin family protein [Calditrichia bacterium]NUQ43581.1 nucleotidyl transferase AbiEii/AbiGii toxin family protein [Calditrichaceae bacterium]
MTKKEFLNSLARDKVDAIQQLLDLLVQAGIGYCVIGGLAVNAYVEPVVSLDLDLVIAAETIQDLRRAAEKIFTVKEFSHSLNLNHPRSELRIQIRTDARYQTFIGRAIRKTILGYEMQVAALEDVLQGKVWAYLDPQRRGSKRQKDLADIFRLVESYPQLKDLLPDAIKSIL